jgi:hypothetical protein
MREQSGLIDYRNPYTRLGRRSHNAHPLAGRQDGHRLAPGYFGRAHQDAYVVTHSKLVVSGRLTFIRGSPTIKTQPNTQVRQSTVLTTHSHPKIQDTSNAHRQQHCAARSKGNQMPSKRETRAKTSYATSRKPLWIRSHIGAIVAAEVIRNQHSASHLTAFSSTSFSLTFSR